MALAILSVVVFILARATGDPLSMVLPMSATRGGLRRTRAPISGLDRPYVEQYLSFVGRAVIGDFGTSIRARKPVSELLQERLPNSLKLAHVRHGRVDRHGVPARHHGGGQEGHPVDRVAQIDLDPRPVAADVLARDRARRVRRGALAVAARGGQRRASRATCCPASRSGGSWWRA